MPFKPGQSGNPKGKPKGVLSTRTIAAKEAVAEVFEMLGATEGFCNWAKSNRSDFYKMFAKSIPVDVQMKSDNVIHVVYDDPTLRD